jgi:heme exporter protein A
LSAAPLLDMRQVACLRGGRLLFEGLDLRVEPGGAVLVTGPNGAGKSSLLRLGAGLLRPAAGSVARPAMAALADERLALDEGLPLARALRFWSALDRGNLEQSLQAFGLTGLASVPVRMLSTGQRKRAALARVAASGAPLWLLDEPANGLDPDGEGRLAAAVEDHRQRGGGVLIASHQPIALPALDRLALG